MERRSRLRPVQDACGLVLLAPLDASLIHRSDPQCPHSHDTADYAPLPCYRQTRSIFTKTVMPRNSCGIHPLPLGCIRERSSLSILLHQSWSRFPSLSLFLGPSDGLLHNRSSSLSIRGMQRGAYHLSIPICKPPNSPSPRIGSSEHIELHDRIAPTPPHLLSSVISFLLHYCPPSHGYSTQLAVSYLAHTPHCALGGTSSPVCNGRCRCTSTSCCLASTT